jgi:hypothetical protein
VRDRVVIQPDPRSHFRSLPEFLGHLSRSVLTRGLIFGHPVGRAPPEPGTPHNLSSNSWVIYGISCLV